MAKELEGLGGSDLPPLGLKLLALLILVALLVQSDFFADAALSRVDGALAGREPTATGVAVRAVAIGGLFAVAHHMVRKDLL